MVLMPDKNRQGMPYAKESTYSLEWLEESHKQYEQEVIRAIRQSWMEMAGDVLDATREFGEPGDYPMKQESVVEIVLDRGIEHIIKGECLAWWRSLGWQLQNHIGFKALPEEQWVM